MIRPLIVTIVALLPAMTGAQADQNRSTAQLDMEIGVWAARTERGTSGNTPRPKRP